MKIAVLTNSSDMAKYFVSKLAESIDIAEVVVEHKKEIVVPPKHKIERMFGRTVFTLLQSIKHAIDEDKQLVKVEQEAEKKAKKTFFPDFDKVVKNYNFKTLKMDFNDKEDLLKLKEKGFDLFILFGTSIVKKPLLDIPFLATINIHTSLLPYYKGTAVEFWQLFNEEYKHCGVTVHYVDTGVDSGNILLQEKTEVEEGDTFFDLRYRNTNKAIELVPQAVLLAEKKFVGDHQVTIDQKVYKAKMLDDRKKIELYKRLGMYR